VWFADVVGYTALASTNEDAALRTVETFQRVVRAVVAADRGQVVKFLGDGALAAFETAGAAASAAARLREEYAAAAWEAGVSGDLRIGVHLGEVVTAADGDVYGDGVNVASRLQAAAEPGEILASEDVWRQLRRREGFALKEAGERALRGIAEPMPTYRLTGAPATVAASAADAASGPEALAEARSGPAAGSRDRRRLLSYAGIGALLAILLIGGWQFLGRGGASDIAEASIAVLPFKNLSDEAENEYFSDGMTDDILTALSKIGDIRVVSRTSTLQYKGTTRPIREIAAELEVATILEGTVRRSGDRVRITAQLVNAQTDEYVWAETYDRELADVFAIQSEIAARIADALHVALTADEAARIDAGKTENPEAYDLVLQARKRVHDTAEVPVADQVSNANAAIRLLRRALELDPAYAQAHATLAQAYAILVNADNLSWADSARVASMRAIELSPELAEAYTALGWTQLALWRLDEALASSRRAIDLDPNDSSARDMAATVLMNLGHYDEALKTLLPAVRRDPGDVGRYATVADLYFGLGLSELARAWSDEAIRRQPDNGNLYAIRARWAIAEGDLEEAEDQIQEALTLARTDDVLGYALMVAIARGRYDEAQGYVEELNRGRSFEYAWVVLPGFIEWKLGNRAKADSLFREGTRRSQEMIARVPEFADRYHDLAIIAAVRGNLDEAIMWEERAYQHGLHGPVFLRSAPVLENLRRDPRFERLMQRMEADVARMRERAPKERP
jgi:adenylate cyclase